MTAREIFDETEIFTEALGASVAQGNLTVAQIKRQLEDGLAYVETQGADNVAEELLVALAALDKVIQRVTGPVYNLGADRFPAVDARSVTAPATLPGASPTEAESAKTRFKRALDYDDREERGRLLEDEGDVSEAGAADPRRRHTG